MATTQRRIAVRQDGRRFDPTPGKVRYSPRWLGAGAGAGVLATMALAQGGLGAATAMGAAGLAGAAYALLVEPRRPQLERLTLRFPTLPAALDGLRIGQISDMHLGMRYASENSRWAVERMAEERPELLVLTGDFVSYDHAIEELPALLAPLQAPLGMFAVPGNHDYYEGVAEVRQQLEPLGVQFLLNTHRRLHWQGAELVVAGVDDPWDGRPDLRAALEGAPSEAFRLLLSHCPDMADEAATQGVQLQLSGHTHGGHLRLPGLGAFCLPRYGWRHPVGHEQIGATQLYVSRGIGGMPLRFGCPPEATIITLRQG